jgi:hypothetical protein
MPTAPAGQLAPRRAVSRFSVSIIEGISGA